MSQSETMAFKTQISSLESKLAETNAKKEEMNSQLDLLSQNLRMEQDTSNNLLMSLEAAQDKI